MIASEQADQKRRRKQGGWGPQISGHCDERRRDIRVPAQESDPAIRMRRFGEGCIDEPLDQTRAPERSPEGARIGRQCLCREGVLLDRATQERGAVERLKNPLAGERVEVPGRIAHQSGAG